MLVTKNYVMVGIDWLIDIKIDISINIELNRCQSKSKIIYFKFLKLIQNFVIKLKIYKNVYNFHTDHKSIFLCIYILQVWILLQIKVYTNVQIVLQIRHSSNVFLRYYFCASLVFHITCFYIILLFLFVLVIVKYFNFLTG